METRPQRFWYAHDIVTISFRLHYVPMLLFYLAILKQYDNLRSFEHYTFRSSSLRTSHAPSLTSKPPIPSTHT